MNIDDLFEQRKFRGLVKLLTQEMARAAGQELYLEISFFFEKEEKGLDWFYSPNQALGGERPYDVCKRGQNNLVRDILYQIDYGIYS